MPLQCTARRGRCRAPASRRAAGPGPHKPTPARPAAVVCMRIGPGASVLGREPTCQAGSDRPSLSAWPGLSLRLGRQAAAPLASASCQNLPRPPTRTQRLGAESPVGEPGPAPGLGLDRRNGAELASLRRHRHAASHGNRISVITHQKGELSLKARATVCGMGFGSKAGGMPPFSIAATSRSNICAAFPS